MLSSYEFIVFFTHGNTWQLKTKKFLALANYCYIAEDCRNIHTIMCAQYARSGAKVLHP